MPASHLVHALALLHHRQANRALLCRAAHRLPQSRLDVALHSSRHLHPFHLREASAVGLDHAQPRGRWAQGGLRLHYQLAHSVEQLHPEVGEAFVEAVGRFSAYEQV